MLVGQWLPGRGDSGLPEARRPPALPGHPISVPGLARNGFIWCKALSHGNKVTELVFGQVLHLPSGKLSIPCEPRPFPGWPQALRPCPMLQTHHLHPWTSLQSPLVPSHAFKMRPRRPQETQCLVVSGAPGRYAWAYLHACFQVMATSRMGYSHTVLSISNP